MDFSNPVDMHNFNVMQNNNIVNQQNFQNFIQESQRFNDECMRNNALCGQTSGFDKIFKISPKLKEKLAQKYNPDKDVLVKTDCKDNRVGGMTPDGKLWDGVKIS